MVQIERARNGSQARFIDQHTTQHLEWHSQLMDELKLTAKKNGIVKPSKTELENLARDWADGRSRWDVLLLLFRIEKLKGMIVGEGSPPMSGIFTGIEREIFT